MISELINNSREAIVDSGEVYNQAAGTMQPWNG